MPETLNLPPAPAAVRPAKATGHVLVVEDDVVSRNFLRCGLAKQGYAVGAAEDVAGAKNELLRAGVESWDCVVTDYRMPNATGLDLLVWVKERDPSLATIVVTAQGEKELIAESLRGGAADFLDKPVDLAQLSAAVNRAIEQTRRLRHMAQSESAVKDLGRAQQWMLGGVPATGSVRADLCFHPRQEAGGDFFTRFQLSPHQYFFLLTDVSGHDLQAAYVSAYFQGLVRGMLDCATPIEAVFSRFNRFLLEEWNHQETPRSQSAGADTSVAACALLLDTQARTARALTHGMPAPVRVASDGRAEVVGEMGGFPLGWFREFEARSSVHAVAGGGLFYLWTDGLEDLAEKLGVGPLSLAYALRRAQERGEAAPGIEAALDDILVARVRMAPPHPTAYAFECILMESCSGAEAGAIDRFQEGWRRSLLMALPELSEAKQHDVLLACREAMLNGLTHGCAGRADQSASIQFAIDPAVGLLRVRVCDPGAGHLFDLSAHEASDEAALVEAHRGLLLVRHLASRICFERDGATVIMDFCLVP